MAAVNGSANNGTWNHLLQRKLERLQPVSWKGLQMIDRSLDPRWQPACDLELPSRPGNELVAVRAVLQTLKPYQINARKLDQMKTAIAEATMNAMEHGNHFIETDPVRVQVQVTQQQIIIRVMDHGDIAAIPDPEIPDIDAKLAGKQSPRGWGMFLIRNMVDEMYVYAEGEYHITELVWYCDFD